MRNNAKKRPARKAKATTQTKPKARPRPGRAKVPKAHVDTVIGIINPFSEQARGIKYPDESSTKTLPFQRHERLTLTTSNLGTCGAVALPNYAYTFMIEGSTAANGNISLPELVTLYTSRISCDSYRIVSWGIKVSNICAPLAASGMVSIRGWSATAGTALGVTSGTGYNSTFSEDIPLQDCKEVMIIGQVSDITSTTFVPQNEDMAANQSASASPLAWTRNGFNALSVALVGGPVSTPCVLIELIVNYELMFFDHDGVGILATRAPEYHQHVEGAHKHLKSKMKNVFKKGAEHLAKHAAEAAVGALADAYAPGTGPAAQQMIRDVD